MLDDGGAELECERRGSKWLPSEHLSASALQKHTTRTNNLQRNVVSLLEVSPALAHRLEQQDEEKEAELEGRNGDGKKGRAE